MASPYDRLAAWYDWISWPEHRIRRRLIAMVAPQPGERLVVLGCGTGHEVVMSLKMGKAEFCVGLDLSNAMCCRARQRLEKQSGLARGVIIQADVRHPPLAAGVWDAIIMAFALEIFSPQEAANILTSIRLLLRPQGRLGLAALVQHPQNWAAKAYTWLHYRWPQWFDCCPIQAKELVAQSGLQIEEYHEVSLGGLPVGLLLAKRI